ncbi:MAG: prepilin-type N-terminal cleavage/methylation domain-containing protein [Patescibacteria group bacterium]
MKNQKGFTLIELLIVIAIISILAAIVFVALDPATRFADARDARRQSDVTEMLHAIKIDQVDNGGSYLAAVAGTTSAQVYMIGTAVAGCDDQNAVCDTNVNSDTHCVNLTALATDGYLGSVPISPNGSGTWDATITGYTLERRGNGILVIRACESENTSEITASR